MFVFRLLLDLVEETEVAELGVIRAEHHGNGLMMWISDEGGMRGLIGVAAKADASALIWRLMHEAPPKGVRLRSDRATRPADQPIRGARSSWRIACALCRARKSSSSSE